MFKRVLILLLMAAIAVAAFPSCGEKEDPLKPNEPEVEVLIDTTIIVGPYASSTRFSILSHYRWEGKATKGGYWCHLTPSEGGRGGATIAVNCDENDEFMVREAHIQLYSEAGTGSITVIQQQIDVLDVKVGGECEFGPEGGNFAVDVGYNIPYDYTISAGWVREIESKALLHSNKLFTVDKNNTGAERSCELVFTAEGFKSTITVVQAPAYIHLSMDDVALEASVDYFPLLVDSNVSYSASAQSDGWLSFAGESAAGSDGQQTSTTFELSLQENESWFIREGTVVFGNDDYNVSCSLHILQKAVDIIYTSMPLFEFGPEGATFKFDIDPTREYEFELPEADWLTLAGAEGLPARRVITVAKNLTGEERMATLSIIRGKARKTLDIKQKSAMPEFSEQRLEFPTEGGSVVLKVDGSVDYTFIWPSDAPWCSVSHPAPGEYTIAVEPNEIETERTCSLVFVNEEYGVRATVEVVQAQHDAFEVSPLSFIFGPEGGRAQVNIHANMEYGCTSDAPEWLSELEEERTPKSRIYEIALNDTALPRTGTLTFTAEGYEFVVTIDQEAAYISASEHVFTIDDSAGQGAFDVSANVPYEAVALDGDWLTLDVSQPGRVTFAASENNDWGGRTAKIILRNDNYPAADTVVVTQGAKFYLDIDRMDYDLPPQGSSITVGVSTNAEFSYSISGSPDWIRETSRLVFEIQPNTGSQARSAEIVFEQLGMSKSVTITQDAPILMVEPEVLEFGTEGGEAGFSITANVDYTVSGSPEPWMASSKAGGASYTVAVAANEEPQGRECVIDIASEEFGRSVQVVVRQAQKDVFELDATRFDVQPDGGRVDIGINANIGYDVVIGGDWVAGLGGGSFTVSRNTSGVKRECIVEFRAAGITYPVTFVQEAPFVSVDKRWLDFPVSGGTIDFKISSNIGYEVVLPDADWVECVPGGDGLYTVTAGVNEDSGERSSAIIIRGIGYDIEVKVNLAQAQLDFFEISTTEFEVSPEGGVVQIPLRSNINYTYVIGHDWISDAGSLTFTVDKNSGTKAREGVVEFRAAGKAYPVWIHQAAPNLTVEAATTAFHPEGGEATVTVSSNVVYQVTLTDVDWLSLSGGEDGVYTIAVAANEGFEPREAVITVAAENFDLSRTVTISQEELPLFEIEKNDFVFACTGGELDVNVKANIDYTYSIDSDWITDKGGLTFGIVLNDTGRERTGRITFTAAGENYVVIVTQGSAYLTVDTGSVEIEQEGGSLSVKVGSNVQYELVMPSEDWISKAGGVTDGVYSFKVQENTSYKTRKCGIVFLADDYHLSDTVFVSQPGKPEPFVLDKRDHYAGPCEGRLVVGHTACEDVYVSLYSTGWIRELEDESTDTGIVFYLDKLEGSGTRQAVATITGNGITKTAYIFQNPPQLVLSYNEQPLLANGGILNVVVTANFPPEVSIDDDWLTAEVNDAGDLIVFTVAENDTDYDRTAVVRIGIKEFDFYRELTITQKSGGHCHLDPDYYEIAGEGGEFFVTVDANVPYSYGGRDDWVRCYETGEADVLRITVESNPSAYPRTSVIEFQYDGMTTLLTIRQDGLRDPNLYYSDDFSRNGNVVRLQKATEGSGIPIVLMGDAFSDRLIEDGTYAAAMERAVEAFFAIEPFASFREFFDIYMVEVVSVNEVYGPGTERAFSTFYESGKMVTGDDSAVSQYLQSAIGTADVNHALAIVIMNLEEYGGTTYMYATAQSGADYGLGWAVSYVPLCTSEEEFTGVLQHEAGGHGFGKLEDEYFYKTNGEIPEERVNDIKSLQRVGFYKNVDFTSDPEKVRWAKFITDEDYQWDGVGVYEGACFYPTGVYRATEYSMMRYNEGGFNAPSREAIYYRLHKIAYGDKWHLDFDAFKQYDAKNRAAAPEEEIEGNGPDSSPSRARSVGSRAPLPHPVLIVR